MASSSTLSMLPLELIREILYRTPVESLVRSMLTCKQWNALIKEESFIYEHLDRSPVKFLTTDEMVQIMDPVTRTCSETPMPDEFQHPHYIRVMVHCDGLMLCRCSALISSKFGMLALWNPLTRKVSWLDKPSQQRLGDFDYYGIGYVVNVPRRDYKILRISTRPTLELEVQIYECMSKSWRTLLGDTKVDWEAHPRRHGVAVKGNMYWLAKKDESINYILGFDFTDETFKDICFCHLPYDNNYLGCYDGDSLSLLEQSQEVLSPIEVWVSSKLGDGNVSFRQYFSVGSPDLPSLRFFPYRPHPVYCIAKDKLIIACYEGEVHGPNRSTSITLFEIDKGTGVIINQPMTVQPFWNYYIDTVRPYGYVYVPSLVSPPA